MHGAVETVALERLIGAGPAVAGVAEARTM
jgi:hypothetical protein